MRLPALFALVVAVASVSCADAEAPSAAPVPERVACGDSAAMRRIADVDRRVVSESKSDQERIEIGTRARFFVSLSNIADLKCRLPQADIEATLKRALDAARHAEDTASFYERARKWGEADDIAGVVIAGLIAHLPVAVAPLQPAS